MFTLNDNSNKHKVAFYIALVILLVTLRQCQSHIVDATEVVSHSSPKNTGTDVSVIRGYDANKSISEKLTEIRQLLRSLIFDWNLGESGIEKGRTFGRIRMMKNILLPVAFIGGFLTAVILSIKAIGIVNMFLISGLLALNFAMIVGKLFYAKKFGQGSAQTHYHSHYNNQYPSYPGGYSSSYANADSRVDQGLPFGRNLNQQPGFVPTGPQANPPIGSLTPGFSPQANLPFGPAGSGFSPQANPSISSLTPGFSPQANPSFGPTGSGFSPQTNPSISSLTPGFSPQANPSFGPTGSGFAPQAASQSVPFSNQIPSSAFQNQVSPNFNQPFITSQNPTALNSLQQPQQPPTNFRSQMNTIPQNINNNPFGGIQMQTPQQVQQQQPTSTSFNQPLNQLLQMNAFNNDMNFMSNDIQSSNIITPVPVTVITTTPSSGIIVEKINLQEIKPETSLSPLDMEKILTDALAQISERKRGIPATFPKVLRFKRKSTNHQPYLNLLRPFS